MRHICPGIRQGAGKPSISYGESIEEDDMVIRVGNSLVRRRTDKEDKRAISLRELIRRCQSLAKGQLWQPAKRSLILIQRLHVIQQALTPLLSVGVSQGSIVDAVKIISSGIIGLNIWRIIRILSLQRRQQEYWRVRIRLQNWRMRNR